MSAVAFSDPGLYVILTRPAIPHVRFAEICVELGIRVIQLREKQMADKELLRLARDLRAVTRGTDTRFIVNDRPDIALLCQADGVHLGQDDLDIDDIREWFPPETIFGLSTHSIAQAREALTHNPSYIGFGPIYPTPTKEQPDTPVGTDLLREVLHFAHIPVIAIGGIFPENLESVLTTGARNVALVRHFMETVAPRERLAAIADTLTSICDNKGD